MAKKVKGSRFERFCRIFFRISVCTFVLASISLNAMNYSLTTQRQKVEHEISSLRSDIDSLDMEKQKLVAFSRLSMIASENGFEYHQDAVASVGNVGLAE